MNAPSSLIGKPAQLVDYAEQPDLNGGQVMVKSYDPVKCTYKVKTETCNTSLTVTPKQLEPYYVDFLTRYPNAPTVKGIQTMSKLPVGAVIDFSKPEHSLLHSFPILTIKGSCKIVGCSHIDEYENTVNRQIVVKCKSSVDFVEFEDVVFNNSSFQNSRWVRCQAGQILFRRCLFTSDRLGVTIIPPAYTEVDVIFDNCTFNHLRESGVIVDGGRATFLSCKFYSCGMGVVVKRGGSVILRDCALEECVGGVVAPNSGEALIHSCQFNTMTDFGVLVSNGSKLCMDGTLVSDCKGAGVVVEGGSNTEALIQSGDIQDCRIGVRVGNGTVKAQVHLMDFDDCILATYVGVDTIGSFDVSVVSVVLQLYEFVNLSGNKCTVSSNGEYEPLNTQHRRLQDTHTKLSKIGVAYGHPVSTMGNRILKEVGFVQNTCGMCNTVEPKNATYKKCGHCKYTRYCSKDCQIAHYKEHVRHCHLLHVRSNCLYSDGYVSCAKCGSVDAEYAGTPYTGCSRCFGVFYCSKNCQSVHWNAHKQSCKPFIQQK